MLKKPVCGPHVLQTSRPCWPVPRCWKDAMLGEMLRESVETQFLGELGRGSEKGPKKGSFPSARIQESKRRIGRPTRVAKSKSENWPS